MDNLAKEIVTTTTEKYNEEGVIQEKITEIKERTFNTEVKKAEESNQQDKTQNSELIKEAAANIESNKQAENNVAQQPQTPLYQNPVYQTQPIPQYNVVGRQQPTGTTFPWETKTF